MKKFAFLLLFLSLGTVAFADMTIVQHVTSGSVMGQPPRDDTMTIYVKGDHARIDNGSKPTDTYTIVDMTAGKMYMVDPNRKQVMVMSTDMIKQAGKMMGAMGGQSKSTVEKTGKTETVNGFKCDDYAVSTTGGPMTLNGTVCASTDVNSAEFDKFKDFAGPEAAKMFGGDELSKIKGLAIRSTMKMSMMGQNIDTTSEVQKVSSDPVPASMFTLPKDYKTVEAPAMPGQKPPKQ